MINHFPLTSIVTLLSLLFVFWTVVRAGRMRSQHGIKAPATTGHPEFEKAYRVQLNTLEQVVMFLPLLWMFAMYMNDRTAAIVGIIWPVGRALYAYRYYNDPEKRSWGFAMTILPTAILFLGCVISLGMTYFNF